MMDNLRVYELKRGAYVIVDPNSGRVATTWVWFGNLGRNCDTFTKGGENPDDEKCVELIVKNKDDILRKLDGFEDNVESEEGKDFLDEQDEFYDGLEEGREFDWWRQDYVEDEEEEE